MAIFTIVFNIVQGNIVAPIVYSRVVSLHPAVVLRRDPGRRTRWRGSIGMFLVVPFLGVIATVWRTVLHVLDTEPVGAYDESASVSAIGDGAAPPATQATTVTP